MPNCCIIIPCFNETARLEGEAFRTFAATNPEVHFLFVNDGSSDGTAGMLSDLAASLPGQLRALNLERNGGKAEAVRRAVASAPDWKAFDYLGYLDADLAAPLQTITHLRGALDRDPVFEFAMGSRVALLGRTISRHASRHYLGRIFATAVSLMLKLPVYDTQCGAKLFRANLAPALFEEPFVTRWFFDVELLFRILRARGRDAGARIIVEVPLFTWIDKGGSKVRLLDFVKTPLELVRIWRRYGTMSGR